MTGGHRPVERALISVSDKTGVVELARALRGRGVEILSTGGTARLLGDSGVEAVEVAARTGFPEILGGRVKTLHPVVHGGILGRRGDAAHAAEMEAHGIAPIDLVVVNLYPFEGTLAAGGGAAECVEDIDVGGPALIRAAAKNHDSVAVVTDAADYAEVMEAVAASGGTGAALRRRLAAAAFARTAAYDAAVGGWLAARAGGRFPRHHVLAGTLLRELRYGENPHQGAAVYGDGGAGPAVAAARQLQGRELSYNNINDADAALALAAEFDRPAAVVVKHAGPCGAAVGGSLAEAWALALRCDPVSAFGGVVAVNRTLDGATAAAMSELFLEVVAAPAVDAAAAAALAGRRGLRLLETGGLPDPAAPGRAVRPVRGGFLLQDSDRGVAAAPDLEVVTRRAPTDGELADLLFAFTVARHVRSNAVVYACGGATVGIGGGQPSRVDSARIAAWKFREIDPAAGFGAPVVASDAFFPFADGLVAAADAGASAVIQPGGSVRDDEVVAAADERGLAMVFTGRRHFLH